MVSLFSALPYPLAKEHYAIIQFYCWSKFHFHVLNKVVLCHHQQRFSINLLQKHKRQSLSQVHNICANAGLQPLDKLKGVF